jgi:hypothetical protein
MEGAVAPAVRGLWIHGPPGSGKTRLALKKTPPCLTYVYDGGTWDGLLPTHTTILIDNLPAADPGALISHRALCRLVDAGERYVQASNGRVRVFATLVIVTCTVDPTTAFETETHFTSWGAKQLTNRYELVSTGRAAPPEEDSDSYESGSSSEWTPGE